MPHSPETVPPAQLALLSAAADRLMKGGQYGAALRHIDVCIRSFGHSNSISTNDSAVASLLLRRKELQLLLGLASEENSGSLPRNLPDESAVSRARMATLYNRLIQERYAEIVLDFEESGPLEGAECLHRYAQSFSLWLSGREEKAPTLHLSGFEPHEHLPLKGPLATYLALATVRAFHRYGSRDSAAAAYNALAGFFDVPPESDFLRGEHHDVLEMLGTAYAAPGVLDRRYRKPETYASRCTLVRSALRHMAEGDFATATAFLGTAGNSEDWAWPLHFRLHQARLAIAIAAANGEAVRRYVTQMPVGFTPFSVHAGNLGLMSSAFEVCIGFAPCRTARAVLAGMLQTEMVPWPDLEEILSGPGIELLREAVGTGRLSEAEELIQAAACRAESAEHSCLSPNWHDFVPLVRTWELCSGLVSPLKSRPQIDSGPHVTDLDNLNLAHEAYLSGMTSRASEHLAEVSDSTSLRSPLDKTRLLLLRFLTAPADAVLEDFESSVLGTLTPALSEALFPLVLSSALAAGASGHHDVSGNILKLLLKLLGPDTEARKACHARLAEHYESTYEHLNAAKHFEELLKQGVTYLDTAGGLGSLTAYRLAKNLFLDFKHKAALVHLESLIIQFHKGHPSVPKRLELLRMAAISHETLQHYVNARSRWEEILELLPADGTQESPRGEAFYRAGKLAEAMRDHAGATVLYAASHLAYEHADEQEAAELSMRRLSFCRLQTGHEEVPEITYTHAPPSYDLRHSAPDGASSRVNCD